MIKKLMVLCLCSTILSCSTTNSSDNVNNDTATNISNNISTNNKERCHNLFYAEEYSKAQPYCEKAANQGDEQAQNILGGMYHNGDGVTQNYKEAAKWFEKSANQGNPIAKSFLATMYIGGKGVKKDLNKAKQLLKSACDSGFQESCNVLKKIS